MRTGTIDDDLMFSAKAGEGIIIKPGTGLGLVAGRDVASGGTQAVGNTSTFINFDIEAVILHYPPPAGSGTFPPVGDVDQGVLYGPNGVRSKGGKPKLVIDSTSISLEASAEIRAELAAHGVQMLAAPVSGNAKVIKAGKLTIVASGPQAAFDMALPYLDVVGAGVSYVGEGELARIAKICHNVMLGVVIQNLCEITVLAEKAGMKRHQFLDFLNKSVMGSTFTKYKTPALTNLDFHVTFTPELLRKDLDLGLYAAKALEVPMPTTTITRDLVQTLIGHGYDEDFSQLLLLQAKASGVELKPENVEVGDGLS
jgi:3-hydroxyisobutyrate dehydrogenase-like beta-hydroxyacid dehydrogenase